MTNEAYDNTTTLDPRIAQRLKHDDKGLVAAVIQQFDTKEVLMVGYMNDEAIRRTLTTGRRPADGPCALLRPHHSRHK